MKNDVVLGQWGLPISWVTLISLQPRVRFNLILRLPPKQPKKSFYSLVKWKPHHSFVILIWFYKKTHKTSSKITCETPKFTPHIIETTSSLPLPGVASLDQDSAIVQCHPNHTSAHGSPLQPSTILRYKFRRSCTTWFRWFGVPPQISHSFWFFFHDKPSILGYVPLSLQGATP